MSIIKEISDEIKDVAKNKVAISKIRKALTLELKLNLKFLEDFSKKEYRPSKQEIIETIDNLTVAEIEAAIKCPFPTNILSQQKVTKDLLGNIKADKTLNNDLETMLDKLYLMIKYLKKAQKKKGLNLYVRLKNIYYYLKITLRLLEM